MHISPIMRLLMLTAMVAILLWLYKIVRAEYGYVIGEGLLALAAILGTGFALYAILFLIVWPLGWLGQYTLRHDDPASPFAEDRLPPTQVEVRHEHDTTV